MHFSIHLYLYKKWEKFIFKSTFKVWILNMTCRRIWWFYLKICIDFKKHTYLALNVQSLQKKLNLEVCLIFTFQINYIHMKVVWMRLYFYLITYFYSLFDLFVIKNWIVFLLRKLALRKILIFSYKYFKCSRWFIMI